MELPTGCKSVLRVDTFLNKSKVWRTFTYLKILLSYARITDEMEQKVFIGYKEKSEERDIKQRNMEKCLSAQSVYVVSSSGLSS